MSIFQSWAPNKNERYILGMRKKNVAGTNERSLIWAQIFQIQWILFHKNGVFYFINKKMQIFSIWFVSLYALSWCSTVNLVWFGLNVYRRFRVLILMDQLFHLTIFSHFMFYFQSVSVIINGWILSFVAKWFRTNPDNSVCMITA